MFELFNANKGT